MANPSLNTDVPRAGAARRAAGRRSACFVRQLSNGHAAVRISPYGASQIELVMRLARAAFFAVTALVACSCATSTNRATLPEHVALVGLSPTPEQIPIVDLRPEEARRNRVIEANGTYSYLGDTAVEPSSVSLLSSSIAKTLPNAFQRSTIELTRLDLGFWTTEKIAMQTNTPIYVIQGAPAGANILGNLLGQAVVAAIRSSLPVGVRDAAVANIEFRVGTIPVKSVEIVAIQGSISPALALETAVMRALKNISEKMDAMKYWELKQVQP